MTELTPPDARRTAATWVAGTGAFLLLVAAAVFSAVRWDELGGAGRFAVLLAVTGGCLAGGRLACRLLPATGSALLHLGALLVPVDAGAIALHLDLRWASVVLAAGGTGLASTVLVGRALDSVVLRWSAVVAVGSVAAGIAGLTPVPAGLLLAGVAVGAERFGLRRPATVWAAAAGLSPLLVAVPADVVGAGVVHDLGLPGGIGGAAAATLATVVLARQARRHDDAALAAAAAAVAVAAAGALGAWLPLERQLGLDLVAAGAAFVVVELVALAFRRDALWRPVLHAVGVAAEAGACLLLAWSALAATAQLVVDDVDEGNRPLLATVLVLQAAGWLLADQRRAGRGSAGLGLLVGGGLTLATPAIGLCAAGAVAVLDPGAQLTALWLVAVAGLAVLSGRPGAHGTALVLGALAPAAVSGQAVLAAAAGAAASVVVAEGVVLRRRNELPGAPVLFAGVLGIAAWTAALVGTSTSGPWARVTFIGLAWLAAWMADRVERTLGDAARAAAVAAAVLGVAGASAAQVGGLVLVLLLVDTAARRDPTTLYGAAVVLPSALAGLLGASGVDRPWVGVGLTVAAGVVAGLAAVLDSWRWQAPVVTTAAALAGVGVVLAAGDPRALGHALVVAGVLVLAGGLAARLDVGVHAGLALLTLGAWSHLGASGVGVPELYAAPVAAQATLAGALARRRSPAISSWVAYAPGIALLGGIALLERLGGGSGGHALVAGAVGVVAVVAGGTRRLAAPLLLGTGLCVAVAGHEAVAVTASVPTWGWLAVAGAVLLGAGVAIERTDTDPVASGRRLADTVLHRFG